MQTTLHDSSRVPLGTARATLVAMTRDEPSSSTRHPDGRPADEDEDEDDDDDDDGDEVRDRRRRRRRRGDAREWKREGRATSPRARRERETRRERDGREGLTVDDDGDDARARRLEGRGRRAVTRGRGSRGTTTTLRAGSPKVDKTTGFIESDNTGMGNIFAIEPRQLYTESPTSDKFARQGLGGIGGAAVTLAVVGAVAFATTGLAGFEETNNEFANYNGPSVTSLVEEFES